MINVFFLSHQDACTPGLDFLHVATGSQPYILRIEMEDFAGKTAFAEYRYGFQFSYFPQYRESWGVRIGFRHLSIIDHLDEILKIQSGFPQTNNQI